ncbi:MAG: helix-turn-helix transcriptional regulator [Bacillota bacterium]|nr:helix-turn-helix transcriptional regulator [Bacillota bacterium]
MCESENCHCEGSGLKVEGFIVPCILFLLKEKPAHGYEIMDKLGNLGFLDSLPDPSVVYRHLRNLEEEGKVKSELVPGSGGPARKVYSITPGGEDYLEMWILKIRRRKASLESFLKLYEETYPADNI